LAVICASYVGQRHGGPRKNLPPQIGQTNTLAAAMAEDFVEHDAALAQLFRGSNILK
jgi:hypothetical protein